LTVTFLIGGLWHGAGWTFVFWGFMHGSAMVIHRLWQKAGIILPNLVAWFLTFQFVNAAWIFFRADSFGTAINVLKGMCGLNGFDFPTREVFLAHIGILWDIFQGNYIFIYGIIAAGILLAIFGKNSNEMESDLQPNFAHLSFSIILLATSVFFMGKSQTEFIYFNF
jgi:alginate O-acetyltransferase complex protein AlgI